jgi:CheY-like chemotaxis protein
MKILVAEDEDDIRYMYHEGLIERGHQVILASDGEECLEIYHREYQQQLLLPEHLELKHCADDDKTSSSSHFDVVILDYKMPKKDGLQVAKEILEINPEQRIIFASAYVVETLAESVKQLKRVVELMQKPFSVSALVDTVEDMEINESVKTLMTTAKDIIEDFDNPSCDQIRKLFETLRKAQKFRGLALAFLLLEGVSKDLVLVIEQTISL